MVVVFDCYVCVCARNRRSCISNSKNFERTATFGFCLNFSGKKISSASPGRFKIRMRKIGRRSNLSEYIGRYRKISEIQILNIQNFEAFRFPKNMSKVGKNKHPRRLSTTGLQPCDWPFESFDLKVFIFALTRKSLQWTLSCFSISPITQRGFVTNPPMTSVWWSTSWQPLANNLLFIMIVGLSRERSPFYQLTQRSPIPVNKRLFVCFRWSPTMNRFLDWFLVWFLV